MQIKAKITPFQFYTMLYLGRIFSHIAYISNIRVQFSSEETIYGMILMGVYLLLTSVPILYMMRKDMESSIITRAECISKGFSKALCVIFLLDFYIYAILSAGRFELFVSSVMFPETNMAIVVITLLAASAYSAYKGIEAIGRAGIVFLVPVLFSFAFVFLSLIKDVDPLNYTPMLSADIGKISGIGLYTCSRTAEILAAAILLPFVKNQKKGHLPMWILIITLTFIITTLVLEGVLGAYNKTQLFGMYTLAVLAEFEFIERLDALISCIWMICAIIKLSVIFFICDYLFTQLFKKKKRLLYLLISIAVIFTGTRVVSRNILDFSVIITSPLTTVIYLLSVVGLPILIIILEKIKERRNAHAKA